MLGAGKPLQRMERRESLLPRKTVGPAAPRTCVHVFLGKAGVGKTTCSAARSMVCCPVSSMSTTRTSPETLSVCRLEGVVAELARHGLRIGRVVVNNVVPADEFSALPARRRRQQQTHFKRIRGLFVQLPVVELPPFPEEVRGVGRPRAVGRRRPPAEWVEAANG
jgi:anion-transporting  ArsA/GET3 family ATPase